MKLSLLCLFVSLLLIASDDVMANSVDFEPNQLCTPDLIWHPENLISAHKIDINLDSTNELLLLIQYNNNARFHLFHQTDCGFDEVTDNQGDPINFLSYSSSFACQPIGCHELTFCVDNDRRRYLVNVSGRHTLTLEETHKWQDGSRSDENVTSQITITKYLLVGGELNEVDSQVVPDVVKNMSLFNPASHGGTGDGGGVGFGISSCS